MSQHSSNEFKDILDKILRNLGRFIDYEALEKVFFPAVRGTSQLTVADGEIGGLFCLSSLVSGHFEHSKDGLGVISGKLKEVLIVMAEVIESNKSPVGAQLLLNFFYEVFNGRLLQNTEMIGEFDEPALAR